MRVLSLVRIVVLVGSAVVLGKAQEGQGTAIGFEERFALAKDRERALQELIPGTADYYFYTCLHAQNEERLGEADEVLASWKKRVGTGGSYEAMEMRQALLRYAEDSGKTFEYLERELGLNFGHQRDVGGTSPDLPTRLDLNSIAYSTLVQRALARKSHTISDLEDSALADFVGRKLTTSQVGNLLKRLDRPDLPGLPELVVRDLKRKSSRGFDSRLLHKRLLIDQLDECARLRPELLADTKFVSAYMLRLKPGADDDARLPIVRRHHLERLELFASQLPAAFAPLRAHIQYHRLALDLEQGDPDRSRFVAYLQMPRVTNYGDEKYLQGKSTFDLSRSWDTGFSRIRDDEALVRAYLEHFLRKGSSPELFIGPLFRNYVERILAETMILAGAGDMERWYSLLDDPAYYERLKERVELDFPATQKRDFEIDEPVRLELDVKHVDTLIVKVFEIDSLGFFESQAGGSIQDIDLSIDLDGLVASREFTLTYDVPALRRVRRKFEFMDLDRAGVWVIDFIGGGLSSRAVIRKGMLTTLVRESAAGHVFRVLDGDGEILRDAAIRFAGREYVADERGAINIPYSTSPGPSQIILRHGGFAVLDTFEHMAENYSLEAAIHTERETLLAGETATIAVRPRLSINGAPASLSLLREVTLNLVSTDLDGVETTQIVPNFELFSNRESIHEIRVPARTTQLQVLLSAQIENLSTGGDVTLGSTIVRFPINGIDAGTDLLTALMTRTPEGYALDVRGKNGEPVADRVLHLELKHRHFKKTVTARLKSDVTGRAYLGLLTDIEYVQVNGMGSAPTTWNLQPQLRSGAPGELYGTTGAVLRVAHEGLSTGMSRSVASLLEMRDYLPTRDRFANLALVDGFVELRDLEAGQYELTLHETGKRLVVQITRGPRRLGWGIGRIRQLQLSDPTPFQLLAAETNGEELVIQLANASSGARVHVSATRYLPGFEPHAGLALDSLNGLSQESSPRNTSMLASGREISDEYRYILERRLAQTFPGNMLARAGSLLNPWAIDDSTDTQLGRGGGAGGLYARAGMGGKASRDRRGVRTNRSSPIFACPTTYANLDYLSEPASVLWNLIPDDAGVVRVPLSALRTNHLVRVVAVDRNVTVSQTVVRPETRLEPRDRRLPEGIEASRHVTERRRIEFVEAGSSVELGDLAYTGLRTLDSLASVFQLQRTISGNADLERFEFLVLWPTLSDEEKLERYSEFASHEVHVFLHEKDRSFFDSIVRPYLVDKADKSFIDHWLLDEDLVDYLEPWAFAQLNVVERILLLRSIDEDAPRHVRELVELLPPDMFALSTYFDSVMASGGLDAKDGLASQLGELKEAARLNKSEPPSRPALITGAAGPSGPAGPAGSAGSEKKGFPLSQGGLRHAENKPEMDALEALGYIEEVFEEPEESAIADLDQREKVRRLFRDVDDTQELAESHYWHVPTGRMNAQLITASPFWLDFAKIGAGRPFASSHFPTATRNLSEMLLALAFLDLPFEAGDHLLEDNDGRTTLVPRSRLYLARKEILDATRSETAAPILVGQDFLRMDDPFIIENGRRRDRFVTDEFLRRVTYVCRVVVTNPGSTPLDVDLLLQIPEGALPVSRGFETRGVPVALGAYGSRSVEYAFYFPESGEYRHYPVHVGSRGDLLGFTEARTLLVVEQPSEIDTSSWEHVSQLGDTEAVLEFLRKTNLGSIDLTRIAWRMSDRTTFERMLELLHGRFVFDPTLWSYGIRHRNEAATSEYLERRDDLVRRCGLALRSPLLNIDPVARGLYEHLEYDPLIHGRAHRFGERRKILDSDVARQYIAFLHMLAYQPELDSAHRMEATYYLALQDRVEEALEMFAGVDSEELATGLQYDYMRAYLDFYSGDLVDARRTATPYIDHPITRWRARFRNVLAQLDEAEGGDAAGAMDPDSREQTQGVLAASEPSLELEVEARRVRLTHANLDRCEISYRKMDIELLFSTNPFLQAGSSSFAFVKPNRTDGIEFDGNLDTHEFDLPEEFRNSNVLVQVRAGGLLRQETYYANDLTVQSIENYGQVRVREASSGRLLPGAYVKVYARLADGKTRFHKDGYTDIRGRFDYVSLSGMDGASVTQFALLVLTEENGATVRELDPPAK